MYDSLVDKIYIKKRREAAEIGCFNKILIDFDNSLIDSKGTGVRYGAEGLIGLLSKSYPIIVYSYIHYTSFLQCFWREFSNVTVYGCDKIKASMTFSNEFRDDNIIISDNGSMEAKLCPNHFILIPKLRESQETTKDT